VRVQYMKQKLHIQEREKEDMEKAFLRERGEKDKFIERANNLEKRCLEAQAELVIHRQKTLRLEGEKKDLEKNFREMEISTDEAKSRMEDEIMHWRGQYEQSERQRGSMKRALVDYEKYLRGVVLE
jgi:predicted membrane chloride channel (bestrophin family)